MGGVGRYLISERGGVNSTSHLPVVSSEPSRSRGKKSVLSLASPLQTKLWIQSVLFHSAD